MRSDRLVVQDIRDEFKNLLVCQNFVTDKTGCKMLEIPGASFVADEETIFREVNKDYVKRELEWYLSQSLNVNDIPGGPPKIWQQVAASDGTINSNYGWATFSDENCNQYQHARNELTKNPESRRAVCIYNRPSMWYDYNYDGRSDFMCTNAVQYLVRDEKLHAVVQMRSNDLNAGYRNDRAWADYVLRLMAVELKVDVGNIYWQVGSLHCYQRDFYLIDHFTKTGEIHISMNKYREMYPDSKNLDLMI